MKKIILMLGSLLLCFAGFGQVRYTLPPLPYSENSLEPVMSSETVRYHHGKHVQAYVDKLNQLIPGTEFANASLEEITRTAEGSIFNNGAQILNHIIFFNGFSPEIEVKKAPGGSLADAIDRAFGSLDSFRQQFNKRAADQFGSGWAWLATDHSGNIKIVTTADAENPLRYGLIPILGIDVWEHSYYIDYRNSRAGYLENIWRIVDWSVIEKRYEALNYDLR